MVLGFVVVDEPEGCLVTEPLGRVTEPLGRVTVADCLEVEYDEVGLADLTDELLEEPDDLVACLFDAEDD